MVLMLLFFYLPIGFMIVFSFNSSKIINAFYRFFDAMVFKNVSGCFNDGIFICHNYSSDYCDSCFYDCWDN